MRWRAFLWTLQGRARSSAAMVLGMLDHVPMDARVSVEPSQDSINNYAEHMIRKDQLARLEGR